MIVENGVREVELLGQHMTSLILDIYVAKLPFRNITLNYVSTIIDVWDYDLQYAYQNSVIFALASVV